MTDTQVTWLTAGGIRPAEGGARPADRQPAGHRRRDQRPSRRGRPPRERRLPRRPRGAGPGGGPHPPAAGAAEQRQGGRGPQAVRCRAARLGRQGLLRRRRVRHRDLPDRHPPGGRRPTASSRSTPRTHRWAARCIDAKVGDTRSYTVPNGNTVKVDAGQRGALPLRGSSTVRPWRRSPKTCFSCCSTTPSAQPALERTTPRAACWPRRSCSTWPTRAGSGPRSPGEPVAAGPAGRAGGSGTASIRSSDPAFALLQQRRCTPAAAIAKLRKRRPRTTSLDHLRAHRADPPGRSCRHTRFSRNTRMPGR